jgi:hypothetical protein
VKLNTHYELEPRTRKRGSVHPSSPMHSWHGGDSCTLVTLMVAAWPCSSMFRGLDVAGATQDFLGSELVSVPVVFQSIVVFHESFSIWQGHLYASLFFLKYSCYSIHSLVYLPLCGCCTCFSAIPLAVSSTNTCWHSVFIAT